MKIKLLSSALEDLNEGRLFYEKQGEGVGEYFFDSLFSDIDSLTLYGGIHPKFFGYHRMLSKRFPYAIYYRIWVSLFQSFFNVHKTNLYSVTKVSPYDEKSLNPSYGCKKRR
jgi:hypothetical protein